jgi:hypothetical protein
MAVGSGINLLVEPGVGVIFWTDDDMAVGNGSGLFVGPMVGASFGADAVTAVGNESGLAVGPSVGASLGTGDSVVLDNGSGLTLVSVGTVGSVAVFAIFAAAVSAISSAKATSRDKPAGDGLHEDRNTEASTATRAACFMAMWKNALTDCAWALSIQRAPIGTASHALCKNSKTKKPPTRLMA